MSLHPIINDPDPPPRRKVPPPCWTPGETFALVHAYRDIWFSLRRRNLRSPDWDAVSAAVSTRRPPSLPPKSSLQCRHKIEKLRKRYRSEKRRSLAFPARFSSSWDLYPLLDSMDIAVAAPPQGPLITEVPAPELRVIQDRNLVTRASGSTEMYGAVHHFHDSNSSAVQFNNSVPGGLRVRKGNDNYAPNLNFDYSFGHGVNSGCGFPVKSISNRNLMPPGIRTKIYNRIDDENDKDSAFYPGIGMPCDRLVPSGFRSMNYDGNVDSGEQNANKGVKRKVDPVEEIVASIKMLGEGFVHMEMKKMELAREFEKLRMDAEIKRNEMMIQSQQQIVNAFINALSKKVKEEPSHS